MSARVRYIVACAVVVAVAIVACGLVLAVPAESKVVDLVYRGF